MNDLATIEAAVFTPALATPSRIRGNMLRLEAAMLADPRSQTQEDFPTFHKFVNGQYIRESHVPKGYVISTRIHKYAHPMFLMSGIATIISEDGVREVAAPFFTITQPGTKRIVYMNTDTICVTVHRTDKIDVKEVEEEIWAKSFDELGIEYDKEII